MKVIRNLSAQQILACGYSGDKLVEAVQCEPWQLCLQRIYNRFANCDRLIVRPVKTAAIGETK